MGGMSLFGILNINKPPGCTSRDVVNCIERLARPARCGHAGTLDPLASGVLVVCVGRATRLIRYVQRMPKRYRATFLLGRSSPTDDVEGEIAPLPDAPQPSREVIEALLPRFVGSIEQRPPDYSAIKIAGKRAYELARRGEALELAPRTVTIYRLAVERYDYPELELEIECGSGTYVRALGRDLAAALGTATVMSTLERTAIGGFAAEDAVRLDDLKSEADVLPNLHPPLSAVTSLPRVMLTDDQHIEIHHGRPIARPTGATGRASVTATTEWAAVDESGQLVAILYDKRAGEFWPAMNFSSQFTRSSE